MRAAGIDAFAAAVGQRGRAGAAEQARQPARQIAADHVAVLGIGRPAPDQLRQDRRAAGERALHRILEVEQAQIILAPLADDDSPRALVRRRRTASGPSASSCRCSALVKVETHTVAAGLLRPQATPARDRPSVLPIPVPASASSMFGASLARFGANTCVTASAIARCPSRASARPVSRSSLRARLGGIDAHRARRRPLAGFLPLRSRENSIRSPCSGRSSRAPTSGAQPQPSRCSVAFEVHAPFALAPVGIPKRRQQPLGDRAAAPPPPPPRSPAARARPPGSAPPPSAPRSAPDGRRRTARARRARDSSG